MRWRIPPLIAGAVLLLVIGPAEAGIPIDIEETCPIGGEEFIRDGTASCSTYGMQFDLKRRTSCEWVKWPVICPGNGFPIYKRDFSPDELKRLGVIVEGESFQKARMDNVPSFMLFHLKKALGENDATLADALLPAIWDAAEEAPERLPFYLELAIDHNLRALAAMENRDQHWWRRQILTANFERRLGRFEAAEKRLMGLPGDELAPDDFLHRVLEALLRFIRGRDTEPQMVP